MIGSSVRFGRDRNDFQLALGEVTQVVKVKTAATALQTESAMPGLDITNSEFLDLPLGRRNWDDLLLLSSGVSGDRHSEQGSSTASGRTAIVDVHGVRSLQNNFLLDGVDNNTTSENVLELSVETIHESVDAIQEFRLITDPYSAEYGRSPGAAVVVATKGGTDKFHGPGWEFVRNNIFDSTDFFTNRSGQKKSKCDLNQFGGNIGGPILKDRAFFFFNYEGQRLAQGIPLLSNVPTASERVVSISYVYQIPEIKALRDSTGGGSRLLRQVLRDWRFSGIATGRTGEPFSIEDSNLSSKLEGPRGGLETAYADCLGNGALSAGPNRSIYHWFNTADYAAPPIVELPNCG